MTLMSGVFYLLAAGVQGHTAPVVVKPTISVRAVVDADHVTAVRTPKGTTISDVWSGDPDVEAAVVGDTVVAVRGSVATNGSMLVRLRDGRTVLVELASAGSRADLVVDTFQGAYPSVRHAALEAAHPVFVSAPDMSASLVAGGLRAEVVHGGLVVVDDGAIGGNLTIVGADDAITVFEAGRSR